MSKKKSPPRVATKSSPTFVVVIGTSLGGNDALVDLVSQLPQKVNAAFFIVIHVTEQDSLQLLANRLSEAAYMPCTVVSGETTTETDRIYLAPYNAHLLLKENKVLLGHGPPENRWRPSIDIMFRSAAAAYGSNTVGVVLTGKLDDGVSGMVAIHRCKGVCIVQEPKEAAYNEMPTAVINAMKPDYSLPLKKIGSTIGQVLKKRSTEKQKIPPDIIKEAQMAEKMATSIESTEQLGNQSVFTCPDCGGALWHIKENGLERYRCYTGHAYTQDGLMARLSEKSEESLWVAVRLMEERRNLLLKMAEEYKRRGHSGGLYTRTIGRVNALTEHIQRLKQVLFDDQDTQPPTETPEG